MVKNAKIYRNSEKKAIDLVAKILKAKKVERNRGVFDWLRGDTGMRLRVDVWFPEYELVMEYHGIQHFKPNKHMDRRQGRAVQRRKYTELRRRLIPKHRLKLLELRYDKPLTELCIRTKLAQLRCKV